jgi:hypothetical protein
MRVRTWVRVVWSAGGEVGVGGEGWDWVAAHISGARCGAPGRVAVLMVTGTLSGALVEASDGRGEKASSGIGVVLRVRVEGIRAGSRRAMF